MLLQTPSRGTSELENTLPRQGGFVGFDPLVPYKHRENEPISEYNMLMGSFSCNLCEFLTDDRNRYAGHRSGHVRKGELSKRLPPSDIHECKVCHLMFETGSALGGHMIGHRKSFTDLVSSTSFKRLLIVRNGWRCSCCQGVAWLDQPIPLDLDHINGDPDDFNEQNLRLLCPNCHRLTPTWGSKNKGKYPNSVRSQVMKQQRS
jgi:hypothetical protein